MMINIVQKLLCQINKNKKLYELKNGKNVLELPVQVPVGEDIVVFMNDFFQKYITLLEKSFDILKDFKINNLDNITKPIKDFSNAFRQSYETIRSGDYSEAYSKIEKAIKEEYFIIMKINGNYEYPLFRARTGINSHVEDFYHIPFNKTYLCGSYRFSIPGYPCLYLGYSEAVCKEEIQANECTCIKLEVKGSINLVDLTWDCSIISEEKICHFLIAYPIIASCYIISNYCSHIRRECNQVEIKYKEQYLFPQIITMYVKKKLKVDGIRYFSTRNENLNPTENYFKNIVLFPHYSSTVLYDMNLLEKFEWGVIKRI